MRVTVPDWATLGGFATGLMGFAILPSSPVAWPMSPPGVACIVLLVISLGLDVVDGALARMRGETTDEGARLDWTTDVALAHLIGARVFGIAACVALAAVQASACLLDRRVSGRALVTLAALAYLSI